MKNKYKAKNGHPVVKGVLIGGAVLLAAGAIVGAGVGTNWFREGFDAKNFSEYPDLSLAKYKDTEGMNYYFDDSSMTAEFAGVNKENAHTEIIKVPAKVSKYGAEYSVTSCTSPFGYPDNKYLFLPNTMSDPLLGDTSAIPSGTLDPEYIQWPSCIEYGTTDFGFDGLSHLKKIIVPCPVSIVNAPLLKEVVYNCKLTYMPKLSNTGIESITIPETVESLDKSCFMGCESLKEVKLPSKIVTIPDSCFQGCSSLKEIDIPESVAKVGTFAFQYSGLDKITLPKATVNIGASSFWGCVDLKEAVFQGVLTTVGANPFKYCYQAELFTNQSAVTLLKDSVAEVKAIYLKGDWALDSKGNVVVGANAAPVVSSSASASGSSAAA